MDCEGNFGATERQVDGVGIGGGRSVDVVSSGGHFLGYQSGLEQASKTLLETRRREKTRALTMREWLEKEGGEEGKGGASGTTCSRQKSVYLTYN